MLYGKYFLGPIAVSLVETFYTLPLSRRVPYWRFNCRICQQVLFNQEFHFNSVLINETPLYWAYNNFLHYMYIPQNA